MVYVKILKYNNLCMRFDEALIREQMVFPRRFNMERCCDLAVNYCRQATIIAEKAHCKRETYYRNLGCAIERACRNDLTQDALEEAIKMYRASLLLANDRQKPLQCLVSAYGKIYDALSKKGESPDSKFWNEYFQIQRLYVSSYPQIPDSHVRAATYYRNKYRSLPSTPDPKKIETVRHLAQEAYIVSILCSEGTKHYIYQDAQEIC